MPDYAKMVVSDLAVCVRDTHVYPQSPVLHSCETLVSLAASGGGAC